MNLRHYGILFVGLLMLPLASHAEDKETLKMLDLFGDVFQKVREEYVEKPNDKELIEAAINGMLTHLDPHSSYLDKKEFQEMQVQTKGEFGGLGIEVTMEKGLVKIVSPLDETPASKAGLMAGDYITHIDGNAVMGLTLAEAVDKMRGKVGSKVKLTILRETKKEPFEVTLERDVIKIKSVRGHVEGDVGYVRITSFSEQTSKLLEKEIEKQKKDLGGKMKGIVLDLRNNPGGLLDQAIAVSDEFLAQGEIVSTRGRQPESTKRFNATAGDILNGLPIVVLINGGSASASEIVSGALQDHSRAIIMGTKSFGKGSVQTVIPLPDNAAIRLTTSRYYTPSGKSIQAKGITPDIVVEQGKLETVTAAIKNTTEANLPGHLKGDNEDDDAKGADESTSKPADKDKKDDAKDAKKSDKDGEKKPLAETDYQLMRAVDMIDALYIYRNNTQNQGKKP
ncbi:MAG: S41 family peptidase [Proteobacteria bacterium]|nr:S41 family peptidase [Pseudomonadota bacterium]